KAPRPFSDRTAIGDGIAFSMAQFERSGHDSPRRTIDVSGDGANTNGIPPSAMRDRAVAAGITINGIVIFSPPDAFSSWHTHPPGGLDEYYRQNVMGGPGSFVMAAEDFQSFAFAITNKLVREIADVGVSVRTAQAPSMR